MCIDKGRLSVNWTAVSSVACLIFRTQSSNTAHLLYLIQRRLGRHWRPGLRPPLKPPQPPRLKRRSGAQRPCVAVVLLLQHMSPNGAKYNATSVPHHSCSSRKQKERAMAKTGEEEESSISFARLGVSALPP